MGVSRFEQGGNPETPGACAHCFFPFHNHKTTTRAKCSTTNGHISVKCCSQMTNATPSPRGGAHSRLTTIATQWRPKEATALISSSIQTLSSGRKLHFTLMPSEIKGSNPFGAATNQPRVGLGGQWTNVVPSRGQSRPVLQMPDPGTRGSPVPRPRAIQHHQRGRLRE